MLAFRLLLVTIAATVLTYTALVVAAQGWNFLPVFWADLQSLGWRGQFNLDFSGLLLLASLWLAWRHRFSPLGLGLGLFELVGGAPFLCIYLLLASLHAQGDIKVLLLGPDRAAA